MNFEEHCKHSLEQFGNRHEEIHRWLDKFTGCYNPAEMYKHRKHRHHKEGVEEAKKLFGDIGALVAEDHIRCDSEGMLPSRKDYNIPDYDD